MLYRLALIDDETGQLQILQQIVQNLAPDFEVLAFSSPTEALGWLTRNNIHAVLCDIRMEEMDGLTLCRRIRKLYPEVILGVISAHSDFSYAQSAIDIGVTAYLIKPISREKLRELIAKIRSRLQDRRPARHDPWTVWERYLEAASFDADWPFSAPPDQWPACLALAAFSSELTSRRNPVERLTDALEGFSPCAAAMPGGQWVLAAFGRPDGMLRRLREAVRQAQWEQSGRTGLRIALSRVEGAGRFHWQQAWQNVRRLMDVGFIAGLPFVDGPPGTMHGQPPPRAAFAQLEEDVLSALKSGRGESIPPLLEGFASQAQKQGWAISAAEYCSNMNHLLLSASRMLEMGQDGSAVSDSLLTASDVSRHAAKLLCDMLDRHKLQLEGAAEGLAKQIVRYVDGHYCEDLSLEGVAEAFHLSPSYLSSLFKQHACKGFRKYIIDRRIAKAKRLLTDTDLKVYEIAAQVGYLDPSSFVKLFEREAGVSPARFRRMGHK